MTFVLGLGNKWGRFPPYPRKGVIKFTRARASRKSSLFGAGLAGVYVLGNFNEFIYRFKADPGENRSARLLPSFLFLSLSFPTLPGWSYLYGGPIWSTVRTVKTRSHGRGSDYAFFLLFVFSYWSRLMLKLFISNASTALRQPKRVFFFFGCDWLRCFV